MKKINYLLCIVLHLSVAAMAQKKGAKETYNTIDNLKGKLTIGLGMVVDTPSQLSYQYAFYTLLDNNPIETTNKEVAFPVLTLRRGLTSYFIEGIYSKKAIDIKLWQKNTLLKVIHVTPKIVADDGPGEAELTAVYKELVLAISGKPAGKVRLKKTDAFYPADNLVDKNIGNIGTFIYLSAINYIPEIDFKKDIYLMYTGPAIQTEYDELKDLKGKKFKYNSLEDYIATTRPDLEQLFQTPKFFPRNSLEQAQAVTRYYTLNQSKHFFFDSKFVDDNAKIACKKIAFPLWKRVGTALTYYQAGQNFLNHGYPDAAIESFHSALAMCDAVNTFPRLVYFIKSKIYDGISRAQNDFGYVASTSYAAYMRDFVNNLQSSGTIAGRDQEFKKVSNEISDYFVKIETAALNARSQKRSAFWSALTTAVVATASAVNDGMNGSSTLSPETQSLVAAATDNAMVVSDFKTNSLVSSARATETFNEVYGLVVKQIQGNKAEVSVGTPVFAIDFVKRIGDNTLSAEKKDVFIAYSEHIPCIKQPVANYFKAVSEAQKLALLKDIFKKLATVELSLAVKESLGENADLALLSKI